MSNVRANGGPIGDEELRVALARALTSHFGPTRRVISLTRRMAAHYSSFHLEELDAVLEDGTRLDLVFKDLGQKLEEARRIKPSFFHDPLREIEVYESILSRKLFGTPICYGSVVAVPDGQYWLFLERIAGSRLKELGDFSSWDLAVKWLVALHSTCAPLAPCLKGQTHLLECDRQYFEAWMDRAQQLQRDDASNGRHVERIARQYARVVDRLVSLPLTVIHGEFYPSNILVRFHDSATSVCAVDWEMAALGPGLIDLAALTCGWTDDRAVSLARTYYDATPDPAWASISFDEFSEALDCCRLHLAVQWLGWSTDWSPKHDWLNTALTIAERLRL